MTILFTAWTFIRKSLYARLAIVGVLVFGAWQADRALQRAKGRQQVVDASKKEGTRRNVSARKRRDAITPGDARKRLLDYARDR